MKKLIALSLAVLVSLVLGIGSALADPIIYLDRASWLSHTDGIQTIDFEGIAVPNYSGASGGFDPGDSRWFDSGPLVIDNVAFNSWNGNFRAPLYVTVANQQFDPLVNWNSGSVLEALNSVNITLPQGTTSFGTDIMYIYEGFDPAWYGGVLPKQMTVILYTVDGNQYIGYVTTDMIPNRAFIGFTSDVPISSAYVYSDWAGSSRVLLDNVSYGPSPVPLPSALLLFVPALASLSVVRRTFRK